MTPLTTPEDEMQYVPFATYAEQGRALEALQDTAAMYKQDAADLRRALAALEPVVRYDLSSGHNVVCPVCKATESSEDWFDDEPFPHAEGCQWMTARQLLAEGDMSKS